MRISVSAKKPDSSSPTQWQLVNNHGAGVSLNLVFNKWMNIKDRKDKDAWVKLVRKTLFGTYLKQLLTYSQPGVQTIQMKY